MKTSFCKKSIYNHPLNLNPGYLFTGGSIDHQSIYKQMGEICGINFNISTLNTYQYALRFIVEIHENYSNPNIAYTLKKIGISDLITNHFQDKYSNLFWIEDNSDNKSLLYEYLTTEIGNLENISNIYKPNNGILNGLSTWNTDKDYNYYISKLDTKKYVQDKLGLIFNSDGTIQRNSNICISIISYNKYNVNSIPYTSYNNNIIKIQASPYIKLNNNDK